MPEGMTASPECQPIAELTDEKFQAERRKVDLLKAYLPYNARASLS
jgi:hypothetical protein